MPTRTKPQTTPSRIGRRPTPAPQGRLHRPATPQGRFNRPATPQPRFSRPAMPTRRKPQQSNAQKALTALSGALPGMGKSKSKSGGGGKRRAGGMALLAGGLGLAMKNRDKITEMISRRNQTPETVSTSTPTDNSAVHTTPAV
jgi:hypothetical protein